MITWFKKLNNAQKISIIIPLAVAIIGVIGAKITGCSKKVNPPPSQTVIQKLGSGNNATTIDGNSNSVLNVAGDIHIGTEPNVGSKVINGNNENIADYIAKTKPFLLVGVKDVMYYPHEEKLIITLNIENKTDYDTYFYLSEFSFIDHTRNNEEIFPKKVNAQPKGRYRIFPKETLSPILNVSMPGLTKRKENILLRFFVGISCSDEIYQMAYKILKDNSYSEQQIQAMYRYTFIHEEWLQPYFK